MILKMITPGVPKNPFLKGQTVQLNNQWWLWHPMEQQWQQLKQQTSLQTSNSMNSTRPSPTDSATWYMPGTYKYGNDGNLYTISISQSGVHRWIQAAVNSFIPIELESPNHPAVKIAKNSTYSNASHVYKFNIWDEVKIAVSGWGCAPTEVNKIVHIIEQGDYCGSPGYKVSPQLENITTQYLSGFIEEKTFELVTPIINKSINTQIKPRMAKTKSITKKVTQEVRSIETSLINKEEVFKMLALAEATGLPLLLVGEPGVL